ncbi:MAG: hypothetical protein AABX12_05485 [Nanoarchaeota archaeon]
MITKKTCPECGSDNISFVSGDGEHGAFMCRACGNTGTFDEEPIMSRTLKSHSLGCDVREHKKINDFLCSKSNAICLHPKVPHKKLKDFLIGRSSSLKIKTKTVAYGKRRKL